MKRLIAVLLLSMPALADPAIDALFDSTKLHDVRISMSASDWATLREHYLENTNYDATLTFDGETIENCTIRSRGSGTRNGTKPGLRADFNKKVKSQTFHGFKLLVLDNMYNDASFLREQLAFGVFEQMNIVVPRESFARLTVNGEYWGLYAIVEPVDKVFVTTHVDGGDGNLFEYNVPVIDDPSQLVAWDFSLSRGETIEGYVPSPLEPKTHEDDLDGTALLAFIRAASDSPEAIARFIDPHVLLTHYAVEVATAEVDGLTGFFGPNNFYLYQRENSSQFVFIPWDHDFNFVRASHDVYFGANRNRLIQTLLGDPELRAFYLDTLHSVVTQFMTSAWMQPRIDAKVALIRASVLEDTKRRATDFDAAIAQIEEVIADRAASIDAQLANRRNRAVHH